MNQRHEHQEVFNAEDARLTEILTAHLEQDESEMKSYELEYVSIHPSIRGLSE